jgi:Mrp family chromosome partitioning ATPase
MSAVADTPVGRRLQHIKHIIIVCSGKGGVGKSSVSTQLALSLRGSSPTARVGLLDVDLTGPSIPRMLGLDGHPVHQSSDGWVPVYADGAEARLSCMSVGFLLKKKEDSVVWRGPKKNAMIRQFLSDVRWGELDYLVIDTPPGTLFCSCMLPKSSALSLPNLRSISPHHAGFRVLFYPAVSLNLTHISRIHRNIGRAPLAG